VTIAAGLIVSRFLHYLALSVLFGAAVFPFYGFAPPRADLRRAGWLRAMLLSAALFAWLSGITWFAFTTAGMSGSLSGITDPAILSTMIGQTDFGRVWVLRLLLATGLVLLLLPRHMTAWRSFAVVLGSLVLLASIALTGHAGSDESSAGLRHLIADAFHLVAAGVWVGALAVLARLVIISVRQLRDDDLRILHFALSRFSGIGPAVVAVLVLTGIINPGFFSSGLNTAYTQVLLAKLVLFVGMLLLAIVNRRLTPRLLGTLDSTSGLKIAVGALRTSLLTETALAVLVLAAVAWLGTLSPLGVE
jgi:putative copper resistance protein D